MGAEQATAEKPIPEKPIEDMTPPEKAAFIKAVRQANRDMVDELHRIPGLPPMSLGAQRIETLIEFVMPWDDGKNEERVDFEILWELKANSLLAQIIADLEANMNRAKLTGGMGMPVPPPPGAPPGIVLPGG